MSDEPNREFQEKDDGSLMIEGVGRFRTKSGREEEVRKLIAGRGGMARLSDDEIERLFDRVE